MSGPQSTFIHKSRFDTSAWELYRYHSRPGALERLIPPWEKTVILSREGNGVEIGSTSHLKVGIGPFSLNWQARHIHDKPGRSFEDIQVKGPFRFWSHCHLFSDHPDGGGLLEDRITYRLPFHHLVPTRGHKILHDHLRRLFTSRHATLGEDLRAHKRCRKPMRFLISGGSGLIGTALKPFLTTGGHQVWTLVRRPPRPGHHEIFWDPVNATIDRDNIPSVDCIINLGGDNISTGRWSSHKKSRIIDSRIISTRLLAKTAAAMSPPPESFISASAIGYYGDTGDEPVRENHRPGSQFISDVCRQWEQAALPAEKATIRTLLLRIGVVLSPRGGALQKFLPAAKAGLGPMGPGSQYLSWISIDDMVAALLHCSTATGLYGPVNIAAPEPLPQKQFMLQLATLLNRSGRIHIPAPLIRLLYGQMAEETVLSGCRTDCSKLIDSGFSFRHPRLEQALCHLLGRTRQRPGNLL